jgi:diguanylate cyclase (GGDEF)-like protein
MNQTACCGEIPTVTNTSDSFTSEGGTPFDPVVGSAISQLALDLRRNSWELAERCVDVAIERELAPTLSDLEGQARVAKLPAFIGGLGAALARPRLGRRVGTNPVLIRLARDHVVERERAGLSAREIVQEFLVLRRVLWRFVLESLDTDSVDAKAILQLEDLLNSIIDEVITEAAVTYLDRATHELSERSRRDSLTGLLNHQAFHDRLDDEVDRCERYGRELQVIYLDLDDFKAVNDTHGHPGGDRALRTVAELIADSIRDSDFAGRLGGDEFVICLVESGELAAHLLVDRLRARLAGRIARGEAPMTDISAGCASFPHEAPNASEVLALADQRLYEDKRARKRSTGTD